MANPAESHCNVYTIVFNPKCLKMFPIFYVIVHVLTSHHLDMHMCASQGYDSCTVVYREACKCSVRDI